jgi:hypothetical protein
MAFAVHHWYGRCKPRRSASESHPARPQNNLSRASWIRWKRLKSKSMTMQLHDMAGDRRAASVLDGGDKGVVLSRRAILQTRKQDDDDPGAGDDDPFGGDVFAAEAEERKRKKKVAGAGAAEPVDKKLRHAKSHLSWWISKKGAGGAEGRRSRQRRRTRTC